MTAREMIVSDSTIIRRNENLVAAEIDGEAVMMNVERGRCYGLDAVGTRIWKALAKPVSVGALHVDLLAEYDVDSITCRRDLLALLGELLSENLIVVSNGAPR